MAPPVIGLVSFSPTVTAPLSFGIVDQGHRDEPVRRVAIGPSERALDRLIVDTGGGGAGIGRDIIDADGAAGSLGASPPGMRHAAPTGRSGIRESGFAISGGYLPQATAEFQEPRRGNRAIHDVHGRAAV